MKFKAKHFGFDARSVPDGSLFVCVCGSCQCVAKTFRIEEIQ